MFDYMGKKWIFMGITSALIIAGIISMIFQGFNLDVDFAGGITLTYDLYQEFDVHEVEQLATDALGSKPATVQKTDVTGVTIKFAYDSTLTTPEDNAKYAEEKVSALTTALKEKYDSTAIMPEPPAPSPTPEAQEDVATEPTDIAEAPTDTEGEEATPQLEVQPQDADTTESIPSEEPVAPVIPQIALVSQDDVSPSTGIELARSAFWMSVLAALGILIYVSFRFEFTSAVTAVVALIHDVMLLMTLYTLFRLPVNTSFIAAILTVLGYSINNTIVIFDRIRENTKKAKKKNYSEITNNSINQTLLRSINTTVTTLLTITLIYVMGVPSIKEFALPIIVGIIAGTYSSIFIAGPLWATWKEAGTTPKK